MLKRYLATLFYCACACAMLTSCGSKASGTGEFATVVATANTITSGLDSDVATWVDSTGAKASACVAGSHPTVTPDDVSFNVTSSPYTPPNTGSTTTIAASDLIVTKITLTFTPADTLTPALPPLFQTQYPSAGQRISVGSNTIPIRIVSDDLKQTLEAALDCTGLIYHYRVSISLDAREENTDRSGTINVPGYFLVNLADFTDK